MSENSVSIEKNEDEFALSMGNLYEMNKVLVAQERKMYKNEIQNYLDKVKSFILNSNNNYFMLLCHDIRYFTLFNIKDVNETSAAAATIELKECFDNLGELRGINPTEDGQAYEFWFYDYDSKEAHCAMFFPYDLGVIEVN